MQIKTKFKRNNLVEIIGEKLNTKELTDIISSEINKEVKLRFYTQKDPNGNKWKPNGRGGKILRDTGQLMNSIHSISEGKFVFVDEFEISKRQFFGINKKLKDRIKKF